ncbi:MAG: hypothetical protein QXE05_04630 [Nitrososphaeria archaeon]
MRELLEIAKRRIFEKESEKKIKRMFSEEIPLMQEWRKKYSSYTAFLHSHKMWIQSLKLKIIDKRETTLYSTTEALRELLEEELDNFGIKKLKYRTDFKKANSLYFPFLFTVGEFRNTLFKVDIKACFYSIYSRLGVDTNVICDIDLENRKIELKAVGQGRLTKYESELIRKLQSYKTLRNIVYGLTRASFVTLLKPSKLERQFIRGRLQNLDLTVVIASFLHAFVSKFRQYIVYWNIDGGIINPEGFEEMKNYLAELGFELKKETEGEAVILGLGSYKVGNFETVHFQHGVTSHKEKAEYLFSVTGVEKIEKHFRRMLCLKGE